MSEQDVRVFIPNSLQGLCSPLDMLIFQDKIILNQIVRISYICFFIFAGSSSFQIQIDTTTMKKEVTYSSWDEYFHAVKNDKNQSSVVSSGKASTNVKQESATLKGDSIFSTNAVQNSANLHISLKSETKKLVNQGECFIRNPFSKDKVSSSANQKLYASDLLNRSFQHVNDIRGLTSQRNFELLNQEEGLGLNTDHYEYLNCPFGNRCAYLCASPKCYQNAVVCSDIKCKCRNLHKDDKFQLLIDPNSTFIRLQKKKVKEGRLLEKINFICQSMIDWISEFQGSIATVNLNEDEKLYMKSTENGDFSNLNGDQMSQIINEKSQIASEYELDQQIALAQIQSLWNQEESSIKQKFEEIKMILLSSKFNGYSGLEDVSKTHKVSSLHKQISPQSQASIGFDYLQLFLQEMISDQKGIDIFDEEVHQQEVRFLASCFLGEMKIKSIEWLFNAQQNNFETRGFWEDCTHIQNTLIIAKTEYGEIVGGYTPLEWYQYDAKCEKSDYSGRSFLFSLTKKIMIPLQQNPAISFVSRKYGPIFGGLNSLDFAIYACCQQNRKSVIAGGSSYRRADSQTLSNWSVYQQILNWQVYKLKFESE